MDNISKLPRTVLWSWVKCCWILIGAQEYLPFAKVRLAHFKPMYKDRRQNCKNKYLSCELPQGVRLAQYILFGYCRTPFLRLWDSKKHSSLINLHVHIRPSTRRMTHTKNALRLIFWRLRWPFSESYQINKTSIGKTMCNSIKNREKRAKPDIWQTAVHCTLINYSVQ